VSGRTRAGTPAHIRSRSSFVGRRHDIDEARIRLQQSRLVSLVGPGGVGKTRLAEEIADRSARAFRDSVRWIDLASIRDPETLPSTAATALGVTDQSNRAVMDKVLEYLQARQALIVIDNCEHLLDAASLFVNDVLAGCSNVRILATSRQPLGIADEVVYELPPLSIPTTSAGHRAADLAAYESVSLLVERAQTVVSGFALTDANADSVAQVCIQLDGIPLAIELAATRLRSLSPAQLVGRLDHRFALLTGGYRSALPRQQTLRALIDWSYELCSESERALWARLSVFVASLDLQAAETVCGDGTAPDRQVANVLDGLVSKSLVMVDRSTEPLRYAQLMTVREYGQELLDASGDGDVIYRRHRDHYLQRALRSADNWFGRDQSQLLAQLRTDHANLIAALDWSLHKDDLQAAAALAVALRYHWIAGGNLSDGRIRLERLLTRLTPMTIERGNALWVTAWTALIQGDHDGALRHLDECAAVAATLQDRRLRAHHDHWAALHALFTGATAEAIRLYQDAIEIHESAGDTAASLTALFQLAMAQIYDGKPEAALETAAHVIEVADEHGERWNKAYALWVSSVAHYHLGDIGSAVDSASRALNIQRDFKDKICTALSVEVIAWCAQTVHEFDRSAALFGAAAVVWHRLGTSVAAFGPHIERDSQSSLMKVKASLRDSDFGRLSTPRAGFSIDDAVDLALDVRPERVQPARPRPSPLTKRESEVAELLAQGLSNRDISAKLVISSRTVDGHVERILNKLGMRSRTQVVAWVQSRSRSANQGS
jgi:predicted ATPase/DNA-binding CsgD family transcriptional regulator